MSAVTTSEADSSLRATQRPLKDGYLSDPSLTLATFASTCTLDSNLPLTCSVSAGQATKKVAGLHRMAGGTAGAGIEDNNNANSNLEQACSGDTLLESLVACFGVTLRAVATGLVIQIHSSSIRVQGDLDFRGTMSVRNLDGSSVPISFRRVQLDVELDTDPQVGDKIDTLVRLSKKYRVVLQTISNGTKVDINVETL
ncbi:hypothetical protein DV736_g3819, partial [Chaetothyriales sp. CBS 134916]